MCIFYRLTFAKVCGHQCYYYTSHTSAVSVLTLFLKGNCCLKRQEVNGYEDVIDCMFRKLKQRKTSK